MLSTYIEEALRFSLKQSTGLHKTISCHVDQEVHHGTELGIVGVPPVGVGPKLCRDSCEHKLVLLMVLKQKYTANLIILLKIQRTRDHPVRRNFMFLKQG